MAATISAVENALAPDAFAARIQKETRNNAVSSDPDPTVLRAKYLEEKVKRSNTSGISQYCFISKNKTLTHFLDDPYASPIEREPVTQIHEIVIMGGGYGGLLAAARLCNAGYKDILIIEKGSDFGGTWYWNRYPGAQCDIESYIYMPLLEELNYLPTEKYAKGAELFAHAQRIGKYYDLYRRTLFQTFCSEMRWDDQEGVWRLKTSQGDNITARFVIPCGGPLNMPKLPGLPGIEKFKGHQFHSSRWDYEYTGGDRSGNMEKLKDKRVGVIGTGATGVQIIPHLGASAGELYVFQRTPSSIDVRGNRPTDSEWAKTLKKGWQQERMDNFNILISGGTVEVDLVNDGWTDILRSLAGFFGDGASGPGKNGNPVDPAQIAAKMQMADYKKMESIRARVDKYIKDPKTAEGLKPWYNQFCKRPCFHDEYLLTFNRPNVHLVDTQGKGVDAVTEKGVVVDGKEIELDCIIYATGFDWSGDYVEKTGVSIYGRNGISINKKGEDGPTTFHGWSIHDFPNLFMVTVAGSGATPNYTHSITAMTNHFVYVLKRAKELGLKRIECTKEAEDGWVAKVVEAGKSRQLFLKDCTPGYYNDEGIISDKTSKRNPYGEGALAYLAILDGWRKADQLEGLVH